MKEELNEMINIPNLSEMMDNYLDMIKSWVRSVNYRLGKDFTCPITLMNEAAEIFSQLKTIQEYRAFIDYVSCLQGEIDTEINELANKD